MEITFEVTLTYDAAPDEIEGPFPTEDDIAEAIARNLPPGVETPENVSADRR